MLVLRLLLMILTIICLMDGHAEVSSSTTGMRNGGENPAVKPNETDVQILDRKKKKPKKKGKKGKKPKIKKPKPKPKPTKEVTATPIITTSTLTSTSTSTNQLMTTTATSTKTTTSASSIATTATITTTSTATTVTITASTTATVTTTTSTITTATSSTSSPQTTTVTIDPGDKGECKATNGNPCIFPFKDGEKDYNECKNHGGKYFWCATAVYDSGKYKHWSYCPEDGSCPFEGDAECRATNNKPCVFPFMDGNKEYNECADFSGKYFWCATHTNSAGKYTAWSKCPMDGSCPLSGQITTPGMTPTASSAATTLLKNETSETATAIANVENTLNEINETLQNLETADFTDDESQLLETMTGLNQYLKTSSLTRSPYDPIKINDFSQKLYSTTANIKATKQVSSGFYDAYQVKQTMCSGSAESAKLSEVDAGDGQMFFLSTVSIIGKVSGISSSSFCCSHCTAKKADTQLFEYFKKYGECFCYKLKPGVVPKTMLAINIDSGVCGSSGCIEATKEDCPSEYEYVRGGFKKIPDDSRVLNVNTLGAKTKCDCKHFCDREKNKENKKEKCVAFLFNICSESKEPTCILLNEDEPETQVSTDQYIKHYAFCKREREYYFISNGGADSMFPELMGIYILSEKYVNNYPVYNQVYGPGVAFVEPTGFWAVVENKLLDTGTAQMYSSKYPISSTPPTTQWYYDDGTKWVLDATLTMFSDDSDMRVGGYQLRVNLKCKGHRPIIPAEAPCWCGENKQSTYGICHAGQYCYPELATCYNNCNLVPESQIRPRDPCACLPCDKRRKIGDHPVPGAAVPAIPDICNPQQVCESTSATVATCQNGGSGGSTGNIDEELEIYTIPIGQGDSTIIQCPNSDKLTIIDMGGKGGRGLTRDHYKSILTGKTIENIFLTHPDEDHVNYFDEVMENFIQTMAPGTKIKIFTAGYLNLLNMKVGGSLTKYQNIYRVFEIPITRERKSCGHFETAFEDGKEDPIFIPCQFQEVQPKTGQYISNEVEICDNFRITLMAGNYFFSSRRNIKNEMSLVLKVTPKDQAEPSILITGDFESKSPKPKPDELTQAELLAQLEEGTEKSSSEEEEGEEETVDENYDKYLAGFHAMLVEASDKYYIKDKKEKTLEMGLESTVLIVPHHGSYSKGNGAKKFFHRINPSYAIISADPYYGYGHPRCEVIVNLIEISRMETKGSHNKPAAESDVKVITCLKGKNFEIQYIYIVSQSQDKKNHIFQTIRCTAEDPNHTTNGCIKIKKSIPQTNKEINIIKTIMTDKNIKSVEYKRKIFQFDLP